MTPLPPESHYDSKRLQKIFAVLSIVLLASLVGIFAKDYSREWKKYQKEFRALELEKTRIKYDVLANELAKNEEHQNALKELEEARKKANARVEDVKRWKQQTEEHDRDIKFFTQQSQFAKAQYDVLKYKYEHAGSHNNAHAGEYKTQMDALNEKIN